MRVAFALRSDARVKPGGDSDKVEKLATALDACGHASGVVYDVAGLRALSPDVVHLFNLDLPVENLRYAQECRRMRTPFVLSTIFHPPAAVDDFVRHGDDAFNRLLVRLRCPPAGVLKTRELVKLGLRGQVHLPAVWRGLRRLQEMLLTRASQVVAATPGEIAQLRSTFPEWRGSVTAIPNGVTFRVEDRAEPSVERAGLLTVGRVEPRKNQNALLRALLTMDRPPPLLVIGALNSRHGRYVSDFHQLISRVPGARWLDRVPQHELASHYSRARLHASASWCEIASQADIEAVTLGCGLLPTRASYIGEHVEGLTSCIEPLRAHRDPEWLADLVDVAYQSVDRSPLTLTPDARQPWSEVGARLIEEYERVVHRWR